MSGLDSKDAELDDGDDAALCVMYTAGFSFTDMPFIWPTQLTLLSSVMIFFPLRTLLASVFAVNTK